MSKRINVLLCFHSHEPIWEMEQRLLSNISQISNHNFTPLENYFLSNFPQKNNPIDALISLSKNLNAPIHFDASNELLFQLSKNRPDSLKKLLDGFTSKTIIPNLTHAHHTHISLLSKKETQLEIHTNRELLEKSFDIKLPSKIGLFSPECSYRLDYLDLYKQNKIDAIFVPDIYYKKVKYTYQKKSSPIRNHPFFSCKNKNKILSLPLNAIISENVWKGLMYGGLEIHTHKNKGYKLSKAIKYYKEKIEQELNHTPDNGVIVYYSDFEFMGFANFGLDLIEKTWMEISNNPKYDIRISSLENYLNNINPKNLSEITFGDISWVPAQNPVLRFDGLYHNLSQDKKKIHNNNPFLFWSLGKPVSDLLETIIDKNFQKELPKNLDTQKIFEENILEIDPSEAIILNLLFMKRACNWGWILTEDRARWGYLHAFFVLKNLMEINFTSSKINPQLLSNLKYFQKISLFYLKLCIKNLSQTLKSIKHDNDVNVPKEILSEWENYLKQAKKEKNTYEKLLKILPKQTEIEISKLAEVFLKFAITIDYLYKIFVSHPEYTAKLHDHKNGVLYHRRPSLYKYPKH
jgi:hypothetical protein